MPASIARRCSRSSTTCMCEHGRNHAVRPPEWMSITTSAGGNRYRVRKSASCSFCGPSTEPGKERLKFAADVVVGVGVREMAPLQVQRQLEDAVLHQFAAVADEELDVVREQVVVLRRLAVEEVRDEHRAEAAHPHRHTEPPVELAQPPPR